MPTGIDGLLACVVMVATDQCPPDPRMYLCRMQTDDVGACCAECWRRYALYIANGRRYDPYRYERQHMPQ